MVVALSAGVLLALAASGRISVTLALMPLALLLVGGAALIDRLGAGRVFARLAFIGESTYGVYLCHVPLQLALLLLLGRFGVLDAVRSEPAFLLMFIAASLAIGRLSFTRFERPMNRLILALWRRRVGATAPSSPPVPAAR